MQGSQLGLGLREFPATGCWLLWGSSIPLCRPLPLVVPPSAAKDLREQDAATCHGLEKGASEMGVRFKTIVP